MDLCFNYIFLSFREKYGGIKDGIPENVEYQTTKSYKARWRSIWVLYMTMFFSSVGKIFFWNRVQKLLFGKLNLKEIL